MNRALSRNEYRTVIGWDIGGAHVKAAVLCDGRLVDVRQWPCALWQGLHLLDAVIDQANPAPGAIHAITMTGEMVDLFDSREAGVASIADRLARRLGPDLRLFGSTGEWITSSDAPGRWRELASANWAATARLAAVQLAGRRAGAILLDIGSTTTDFIPLTASSMIATAGSDAQRLRSGELLYQGVVRTPLCVLASRMDFRGAGYNVMNEWFATTADVYRLTGELDPAHDQHPAADNGSKDIEGSCRRIARMIGHDAADASTAEWTAFSGQWRRHQLQLLRSELLRVASSQPAAPTGPLVGAGCGSFLVQALAHSLRREYIAFHDLIDAPAELRGWVDVCAPAVAVAVLREQA